MYRIELTPERPDQVISTDTYIKLLEARATGGWREDAVAQPTWRRLLRLPLPRAEKGILFTVQPRDGMQDLLPSSDPPLNLIELWDANRLLTELSESSVPRLMGYEKPGEREIVINTRDVLGRSFPQVRAIWSANERVVTLYAASLGCCFLPWAEVWQPSLAAHLVRYQHKIVVIVPAIVRMDSDWQRLIINARNTWGPISG